MDTNGYKPFRKYSFYLDLRNSPQVLNQLTKHINCLGGKIDEFLNKNVKYIVTNRPKNVWPNRESVINNLNNKECDQTVNYSPITKNNSNKIDLFSRGKLLLSKLESDHKMVTNISSNVTKKTQTTDVLELGRIWNIKIIQSIDMLDFCKKHLSPDLTTNTSITSKQIIHLRSPFIKIEDNLLNNKPNYKEFYEWPEINYQFQDVCPFIKKKVQKNLIQNTQSLEGLALNNQLNDKLTNNLTEDKTFDKNETIIKKTIKRRIPLYCEICSTEFDDISKHLMSDYHIKYTQNEDNYRDLKSVISSLPRFNETQNNSKCFQFEDQSESESDEDSNSHIQSTPNMSTTIQFSGSKHKSHFLAIHDLITENNNNKQLKTNNETCNDSDFIPPSHSSQQTINNCLNHMSDESSNELSEEYLIVN